MSFMDKAKDAADRAKASAQQATQQGQEKVNDYKFDRASKELYEKLGRAFHAEQREGGGRDAVTTALADVDAHLATRNRS